MTDNSAQAAPLDTSLDTSLAASPAVSPGTPASEVEVPPVPLLTRPADGVPPVIATEAALRSAADALASGEGPVAIDAERAHGFRYSQRAYLIQLRRAGAGTHLVDPIAFGQPADLHELGDALTDAEWIIHAASQDLVCLHEVGLTPRRLFDTELAARLLNYPRVALGTMIEELLGVRLLKEHSAADWSTRPLPADWLTYAALDVELLIELRNLLHDQLIETGKWEWASEEFAALAAGIGAPVIPRQNPWRRTSGIHRVRTRRALAYVAELWYARDAIAERLDRAPGRVLSDLGISELAAAERPDRAALRRIPAFQRRQTRQFDAEWVAALARAAALPDNQLPPLHVPSDGPPQARMWAAKDPAAAGRLSRVREVLTAVSTERELPVENLLTPDFVRRVTWRPPAELTEENVDAALATSGARPWQRALTVPQLTKALQD